MLFTKTLHFFPCSYISKSENVKMIVFSRFCGCIFKAFFDALLSSLRWCHTLDIQGETGCCCASWGYYIML